MSIELNPIANPEKVGGFNTNFQLIEDELNNNVLRRKGLDVGEANQLEIDIDLNGNDVVNAGTVGAQDITVGGTSIKTQVDSAASSASAASTSAAEALVSENAAEAARDSTGATFDSVADMGSADFLEVGMKVRTLGYYAPGDGGGNDYEIVEAGTGSNYGFLYEQLTASGHEAKLLGGGIMEDKTAFIPSDYSTLQSAIDDLSKLRPSQDAIIDLVVETGHQPTSGILVENGDYSCFQLSSTDASVSSAGDFSIVANNARAIVLNTIIDITNSTAFDSYKVNNGATGFIKSGAGMINGTRGIHATNGSTCIADGAVFTGFVEAGAHSSRSSEIQATSANFSGNSTGGGLFGAVYASRNSRIHGQFMDVTNSGSSAVRAQRFAKIACPEVDVSGAQGAAFLATLGGEIYCTSGDFTANNLEGAAIVCQDGRVVVSGTFSNINSFSDPAIECRSGSVKFSGTVSGYSGIVVYCLEGGSSYCRGLQVTSGSHGLMAEQGGRINARSCSVSDMTGNGSVANRGGFIEINDGSITGSGGNDIAVQGGSWISAIGCTTTNGAGSPNTTDTNITAFNFNDNGNRGFIWA